MTLYRHQGKIISDNPYKVIGKKKKKKVTKGVIYSMEYNNIAGMQQKRRERKCFLETAKQLAEKYRYDKPMTYQQFLETDYWKLVSKQVKRYAGNKCKNCGSCANLHTHHLKYPKRFTEHKRLGYLQCLCSHCHAVEHGLAIPRECEAQLKEMDNRFTFFVDN
jgi:hypothetical protein